MVHDRLLLAAAKTRKTSVKEWEIDNLTLINKAHFGCATNKLAYVYIHGKTITGRSLADDLFPTDQRGNQ